MPIVIVLLLAFFFISKMQGGATIPAGANSEGIGTKCGGIGGFIKGHVDRKNAAAPGIISAVGGNYGVKIDKGTASTIAKYADTFSLSNKIEGLVGDKVGDALCNLDPLEAAAAGAKFLADKALDAGKAIVSGAEYVGGKLGDAGGFVGTNLAKGALSLGTFGKGLVTNPLQGVQTLSSIPGKVAGTSLSLSSRAAGAVYNSLPTPLKVVAAPAYAVEKVTARVTSTVVSGVSGAAKTTTSAITGGVKSATSAVSSGVSKVLGWL